PACGAYSGPAFAFGVVEDFSEGPERAGDGLDQHQSDSQKNTSPIICRVSGPDNASPRGAWAVAVGIPA
ncbi:MAG: hypothetical protein ACK5L2_08945, partial [Planctomyces sp.]